MAHSASLQRSGISKSFVVLEGRRSIDRDASYPVVSDGVVYLVDGKEIGTGARQMCVCVTSLMFKDPWPDTKRKNKRRRIFGITAKWKRFRLRPFALMRLTDSER